MTQPYAHCPFCLQELDLIDGGPGILQFGNMEMIQFECPEHGEIIIISDNIYGKTYGGAMLADCPKCHKSVFVSNMTDIRGNG